MKKRLLIGVVAVEPNFERTAAVLEGVIQQAFKANCDVAVLSSVYHLGKTVNAFRRAEQEIFELILSKRFDGFLYDSRFVFNPQIAARIDKLLRQSGKPVMLIDGGDDHPYFDNTAADDSRSFCRLTEHLIEEHGFRNIYCLTGPKDYPDAVQRLNGFLEAMEKHGLPHGKQQYRYGDYWTEAAKILAADILNGRMERPEAIVCGNDISARFLIRSLEAGGLRVPEDIAVTGFDCDETDFGTDSRVTSYKRANFQLGSDAFCRLYRTITGKIPVKVHSNREVLHIGMTCGCKTALTMPGKAKREQFIRHLLDENFDREDMVFTLSQGQDLWDALPKIAANAFYLYRMRHFALCLTEDFCHMMRENGQVRTLSHQSDLHILTERFSDGTLLSTDKAFSADDVLPFFEQEKPRAYYLTPLHNEHTCFGYAALSYGKRPCTYDSTYIRFCGQVNTLLTLHWRRQMGVHALHSSQIDPITGFPGLQSMGGQIEARTEDALFYIEITDSKLLFCRLTPEDFGARLQGFSDLLRSALPTDALCCTLAPGSFAVMSPNENTGKRLYAVLRQGIDLHRMPFTVSEPITDRQQSFAARLQSAMLRTQFTYSTTKSNRSDPLFDRLCQLQADIRSHPEQEWRIDDIANTLHISRSHLQKSYKQYFGTGIIETVITLRMERAKELLTHTNKSVTEIAELCGYASYVYFTKQFRKSVGMTPSAFRNAKEQ